MKASLLAIAMIMSLVRAANAKNYDLKVELRAHNSADSHAEVIIRPLGKGIGEYYYGNRCKFNEFAEAYNCKPWNIKPARVYFEIENESVTAEIEKYKIRLRAIDTGGYPEVETNTLHIIKRTGESPVTKLGVQRFGEGQPLMLLDLYPQF